MPELKQITFSLFEHIWKRLEKYCDKTGQNITAVLRQAVYEFLNKTADFDCSYDGPLYNTTSIMDSYGKVLGTIENGKLNESEE